MQFPDARCPVCGERAFNATSIEDTRYHYVCGNPDCPTRPEFDGDLIPEAHKAEGRERLRRTIAGYNFAD